MPDLRYDLITQLSAYAEHPCGVSIIRIRPGRGAAPGRASMLTSNQNVERINIKAQNAQQSSFSAMEAGGEGTYVLQCVRDYFHY